MSAVKVKHESRTILNLSQNVLSYSGVEKILRDTKVSCFERLGNVCLSIDNQINIGMYTIRLELSRKEAAEKLRDYGRFSIRIFENGRDGLREVNLKKHEIFRERSWVQRNQEEQFRISDLVEVILLCRRLHNLRAFN